MAKSEIPIEICWEDVKAYMEKHDVVEIIRCRDCRYKYGSDCDNFAGVLVEDNYFCSMAERREVSE